MILLMTGCAAMLGAPPDDDPTAVYDAMWSLVDERYVLFPEKAVDWDRVGEQGRAQLSAETSDEDLFTVMAESLDALEDGHVNLDAGFDISRHWDFFLDEPVGIDDEVIERDYLQDKQQIVGPFWLASLGEDDALTYLRLPSLSERIQGADLSVLLDDLDDADGAILDLRGNGGGSLDNATAIASIFADQTRPTHSYIYKEGPGHLMRSAPDVVQTDPAERTFTRPLVVLTDARSYSAATALSGMLRPMPHVTLLGQTTGGGAGIAQYHELPNGWWIRIPTAAVADGDGALLEDGLAPDFEVDFDRVRAVEDGVDTILEAAITLLEEG
ncbi:MAG: S41 family peptidase [Myxococcota bacterium]